MCALELNFDVKRFLSSNRSDRDFLCKYKIEIFRHVVIGQVLYDMKSTRRNT